VRTLIVGYGFHATPNSNCVEACLEEGGRVRFYRLSVGAWTGEMRGGGGNEQEIYTGTVGGKINYAK
jgi:hypothetical protein